MSDFLFLCTEQAPASWPAEAAWPPQAFVASCRAAAEKLPDPSFLLPALPGLTKPQALALIPQLLGLGPEPLRGALARLLMPRPSGVVPFWHPYFSS